MPGERHPWERIYAREGRFFKEPFPGFEQVVARFTGYGCRRVLDLGCGNGRHLVALAYLGFRVCGLDISPSGLRLSRAWLGEDGLEARLVCADTRLPLPFTTRTFDGLLSTQVVHHALLAEVRVSIAEIWRVLAPGGIAFVSVAGRTHEDEHYEQIEPGMYLPLDGLEQGLPHHIFSEGEFRKELGAFCILEMGYRAEDHVLAAWLEKA
jgi:SAM-dependent methyltransferase